MNNDKDKNPKEVETTTLKEGASKETQSNTSEKKISKEKPQTEVSEKGGANEVEVKVSKKEPSKEVEVKISKKETSPKVKSKTSKKGASKEIQAKPSKKKSSKETRSTTSKKEPSKEKEAKKGLHSKNPLRFRYDFEELIKGTPELGEYYGLNKYGVKSIDFSNPDAVKALNKALLRHHYQIEWWDIPRGYLCPPVPGRADYLHHVADLLKESNNRKLPDGTTINVLDTGTGANCIYPIIGHQTFKWNFVASEIDPIAIKCARQIVKSNKLTQAVQIRTQEVITNIFHGIIEPTDKFDLTVCNPPFFGSIEEAGATNKRKLKNLGIKESSNEALNFGGQNTEFWTKGGEKTFIQKMIKQSASFGKQCFWFTTLVSKKRNLPYLQKRLEQAEAQNVKVINIGQGQKTSQILCWTFLTKKEQKKWFKA